MEKRPTARCRRLWLLLSVLFLAACGGNAQRATPLPTETAIFIAEPTNPSEASGQAQPTIQPSNTPVPEPTVTLPTTVTPSPTPEPTEEPEVRIVTYEDEEHGVVFAYPDNWHVQSDENAVFVFSDESISRVVRYEEGAALFISTDSRLADRDVEAILDLFVGQLNLVSEQEAIAEPAVLTINDQEAAQAVYAGNVEGVPVIVTYTAITNGQVGAVVISVMLQADEELFGDTLADITNSVILASLPGTAEDEPEDN